MTAVAGLPRRALTGALGLLGVVPAPGRAEVGLPLPDARLADCLASLTGVHDLIDELPPTDVRDPMSLEVWARLCEQSDLLLIEAARLRPVSPAGFAIKARIAMVHNDCHYGEQVTAALLGDLLVRGRMA